MLPVLFDKIKKAKLKTKQQEPYDGCVVAKMLIHANNKITLSTLPAGESIDLREHQASDEMNYIISGTGCAVCDGEEKLLQPGDCHYCPKGEAHTIVNTGSNDLLLFTVIPEQPQG